MLKLPKMRLEEFLNDYWQKKPLFIPKALSHFKNPLSGDELAGLAMEEEIESRLVIQSPGKLNEWKLKRGPFSRNDFKKLPPSHWTLLVQGVDRFIPEVCALLNHFNFIPPWRVDDVMISYAVEQGSVGPHFDHYDVFLYQAQGCRRWLLTTKDCVETNFLKDVDLRIMKQFNIEQEYILEEGDMLYLPPFVGHYGISQTMDCMTYSFGYRSYQAKELWDSFGEYLSLKDNISKFYQDPSWTMLSNPSELPKEAWIQARDLMQEILKHDDLVRDWFGGFATQLDRHAESLLPSDNEIADIHDFKKELLNSKGLTHNPLCRFAYYKTKEGLLLYINGSKWNVVEQTSDLIEKIANNRTLLMDDLQPFLKESANVSFLYELWKMQWLELFKAHQSAVDECH